MAASASRAHHQALIERAFPVNAQNSPDLERLASECKRRIQPGPVDIFVTRSRELNAYTFGLSDIKAVVLYSALLQVMDADELRFILGHELGHVRLGHTRLNSLVGGLAGIPSSSGASLLLGMAFLGWNRACEYSCDRAGLLACGQPEKAISALVKLVAGPEGMDNLSLEERMAVAYRQIDAEDDSPLGNLYETLGSHPLLIKRINHLREWAASAEYRQLQARVNQNLQV
jgi:Zn-dependent protease with chaperone function